VDEQLKKIAALKTKLKQTRVRYDALMEYSLDGIYLTDSNAHITKVNKAICSMLGYTCEELLHMGVGDFVDPVQAENNSPAKSKTAFYLTVIKEEKFICKNGSRLDVEIHNKIYNDERSLTIVRDITQRKKMEAKLHEAELKFRTIAERSMVGIYIVQNSSLTYVNPRFCEIFGYQSDEMIGIIPVIDLFHNDYKEMAKQAVRLLLEGKIESVHYEAMCRHKDGSTIWAEFYGNLTLVGNQTSFIGSMIDITGRKRAEERLRLSEANKEAILNTTDTGYTLLDKDLKILAVNHVAANIIQRYIDHIPQAGTPLNLFVPKERHCRFKKYAKKALKGKVSSYEINYPQANGNNFYYAMKLFPSKDSSGEILGIVVAIQDINERKKNEDNLKKAFDRIQTQLQCIKDMAWKQSHLLRSPLANLKGLIGMLQVGMSDPGILEYLQTELDRLDRVIIDMAMEANDQA